MAAMHTTAVGERLIFLYFFLIYYTTAFTKVLVPAVYNEYLNESMPEWMINEEFQQKHGYSVFLYQKLHPDKPNYLSHNRGSETGPYMQYIVDHYDDFPDVAMFVHAKPADHQPHFLELLDCVSPNATYININFNYQGCRRSDHWKLPVGLWVEQCWRETLKVLWELENDPVEFYKRVPPNKAIMVCFVYSHQFILSRTAVHRRPLNVWKKLLSMLGQNDVCHHGEPDYDNLFAYQKSHDRVGPEPSELDSEGEGVRFGVKGWGRTVQGGTAEHLAHVIYGHYDLDMEYPNMDVICQNFLPGYPNSPCKHRHV